MIMDASPALLSLSCQTLSSVTLSEIFDHAEACYPNECCGFVRLSGKVHRAQNDQDRLNRLDSTRWPRTARHAYSLAPTDLLQLSRSFDQPDPAVILYHSHPDAYAYFSQKDEEDALIGGELIYPVAFLVVETRAGQAMKANLFHFMKPNFHRVWTTSPTLQEGVHRHD
jgi:proteasome lid subunit RPN8/RPN11